MRRLFCFVKLHFLSFLNTLFGILVPARVKRTLFSVRVHVKFANRRLLHDPTLEKLNAKLALVHYPETLGISKVIGEKLIPDKGIDDFIDRHEQELCQDGNCPTETLVGLASSKLIGNVPQWLRYGEENMSNDVSEILKMSKADHAVLRTN